jgi:hypothetical protein
MEIPLFSFDSVVDAMSCAQRRRIYLHTASGTYMSLCRAPPRRDHPRSFGLEVSKQVNDVSGTYPERHRTILKTTLPALTDI